MDHRFVLIQVIDEQEKETYSKNKGDEILSV